MTILLSILAVTLLAISVWQITKIFEISNLGAKKDDSQVASEKDNDLQGKLMFAFLVFIYLVTIYSFVCLLYTSPSPRDRQKSRMPSSA